MTKQIILIHGEALCAHETGKAPFRSESVNRSYAHFANLGTRYDVEIGIVPPLEHLFDLPLMGWFYSASEENWNVRPLSPALIYDRFAFPGNALDSTLREKITKCGMILVQDGLLEYLCKDKLATAALFPSHSIPTTIPLQKETYHDALARIGVSASADWSGEQGVSKPRYGSGGEGISQARLTTSTMLANKDTLIQPFLESSAGIPELEITRRYDLRIIMVDGKAVTAEARVAHEKGHETIFFPKSHTAQTSALALERVPARFLDVAMSIDRSLANYTPRIYSVDMAQGASGKVWMYELNSRPLQTWTERSAHTLGDSPELIVCRKQQQEAIVEALARRVHG